jgi:hypothetical protein
MLLNRVEKALMNNPLRASVQRVEARRLVHHQNSALLSGEKRVLDEHAIVALPVLQILSEHHAASAGASGAHHQGVPERDLALLAFAPVAPSRVAATDGRLRHAEAR